MTTPTSQANTLSSGRSSRFTAVRRHPGIMAMVLMILVVAAYWPAMHAGFIMDDDLFITNNPLLTSPHGLREIWFSTHAPSQYFPLVYTTFRLEHALWGFHPFGYHLVNILWHGVNSILVWMLLRRLRIPGAWLAAAIFGLHPVEVETVAWSSELKNIESLFFYLLALLAWLKFIETPNVSKWYYYAAAAAAYLLALFSKTTACTLPAALLLLIWLRGQRVNFRRVAQILPFVIAGLIMGLVSIWWEKHLGDYVEKFPIAFTPLEKVLIASRALWFYAGKLLWPANLTFSYPQWHINPRSLMQYIPVIACVAASAGLWFWRKKVGRPVLASILFFVAALSPLLGFVVEGTFHYTYVADHYQYCASIGPIALVAALSWRWCSESELWFPLQAVVLLVLGGMTWHQCGIYHDPTALWKDTLAKNPDSWLAHHDLGIQYFKAGNVDMALKEYRTAVKLHPQGCPEQSDLGTALLEAGRYDEAIQHLKTALGINPKHFPAQNNLALAYARVGNFRQAEDHFNRALKLDPTALGTRMNLARLLERQGKLDDAIACYRKAANLHPDEVAPLFGLASVLEKTGKRLDAVTVCQQAVAINPHNTKALLALGNACLSATNYEGAVQNYEKALRLEPDSAGLHYNLGMTLGLMGKPKKERHELNEALRLKPDFGAAMRELIRLGATKKH